MCVRDVNGKEGQHRGVLRIVAAYQSQVIDGVRIVVPRFFIPTKRSRGSQLIRFQISPIAPFSACLHTISKESVRYK